MTRNRSRRSARVHLLLTIAFVATACGDGDDGPSANAPPTNPPTQTQSTGPTGQTALTVTPEELASADVVLFTGAAPQGFDNGGFGFEEEDVSSPGPDIRVAAGEPLTLVLESSQTLTIDPGESTLVTFRPRHRGSTSTSARSPAT